METSKYCESRFITSEDLKGRRVTLTIESVKEELLKERSGREVAKLILFFQKAKKGLPLNRTNLKMLWKIFGSRRSENWTGKKIDLYVIPVPVGDEIREGIRIAEFSNGAVKSASVVAPDPDDDVPPDWGDPPESVDDVPDEKLPF